MNDLITYDDDLNDDYAEDRSWPYLAEQGLSDAKRDLDRMLERPMSEAEGEAIERAIEAIDFLFDASTYKDGFRYFSKED